MVSPPSITGSSSALVFPLVIILTEKAIAIIKLILLDLVIGDFRDYRLIGHVCLFVCLSVCPLIIYETAIARKMNFCGLTIYVY